MAYRLVETTQGTFAIDWDVCLHILRAYHRSKAQLECASERLETDDSSFPIQLWEIPPVRYLEVDWAKVQQKTQAALQAEGWSLAFKAFSDAHGVDHLVRELKRMQHATRSNNLAFIGRQRQISTNNQVQMERYVGQIENWKFGATVIRDLSASVILGAATVATGGTALAATSLGAGMKASFTYQDSGSISAAGFVVAQTFVSQVVKMSRGVKILFTVGSDSVKSLLEGKSLPQAAVTGLCSLPGALVGDLVKEKAKDLFSAVALPVVAKVAQDATKIAVKQAVKSISNADLFGQNGIVEARLSDQISLEDDLLLKLAVVDMGKGVGHSWW